MRREQSRRLGRGRTSQAPTNLFEGDRHVAAGESADSFFSSLANEKFRPLIGAEHMSSIA
jgi:hypothetical protein